MPIDEDLLAEAVTAAAKVAEQEAGLAGAKAEYRLVIRRLHLAGASMREIAEALGISYQRVHQIVDGGAGPRRWRRRRRQDPLHGQRACSFCGRGQPQVRKMIAGPDVHICGPCISQAAEVSRGRIAEGTALEGTALHAVTIDTDLACSFCGKRRAVTEALVAGDGPAGQVPPAICNECLALCQDVVDRDPAKPMTIRVR